EQSRVLNQITVGIYDVGITGARCGWSELPVEQGASRCYRAQAHLRYPEVSGTAAVSTIGPTARCIGERTGGNEHLAEVARLVPVRPGAVTYLVLQSVG